MEAVLVWNGRVAEPLSTRLRTRRIRDDASVTTSGRRKSFDAVAELYDRARPSYPDELFGDLVSLAGLAPGDRLLEIGCATGKATRPLLERGYRVVCVELGEQLAERARRNLSALPAEIHAVAFEDWEGQAGSFDLVFAATAWHWLDPTMRYEKAHRLLREGGHLAFWSALHAFPPDHDPLFEEIQEVYDEIGLSSPGEWPPQTPGQIHDDRDEIEASGLFDHTEVRRYVWARSYTAD
jgi:SAM-dependent methyltransferase